MNSATIEQLECILNKVSLFHFLVSNNYINASERQTQSDELRQAAESLDDTLAAGDVKQRNRLLELYREAIDRPLGNAEVFLDELIQLLRSYDARFEDVEDHWELIGIEHYEAVQKFFSGIVEHRSNVFAKSLCNHLDHVLYKGLDNADICYSVQECERFSRFHAGFAKWTLDFNKSEADALLGKAGVDPRHLQKVLFVIAYIEDKRASQIPWSASDFLPADYAFELLEDARTILYDLLDDSEGSYVESV